LASFCKNERLRQDPAGAIEVQTGSYFRGDDIICIELQLGLLPCDAQPDSCLSSVTDGNQRREMADTFEAFLAVKGGEPRTG